MKWQRFWMIGVVAALAIGIACSDNGGDDGVGVPSPTTGASDSAPERIDFVSASGIVGGDPEFNYSALVWQGYWLSRDHFGPFVMASGLGIPFEPPMDMLMMAMGMVAQNPSDPVAIPQNMLPLQAIYAAGSPDLVNDPRDFEPIDFEAFRLDPSTFDETVSVRGQAWTMLKESQWAHSFADPHFGDPQGDFGAQQRFIGVMVSLLAQMQGAYAMQNLMGDDGLYHDSDGALDYTGNWVMLHALSDIAGLTGEEGGRYVNPDAHTTFDGAATQLFRTLEEREPESAAEAASAIRALIYLASTTAEPVVRDDALTKANIVAENQLLSFSSEDVTENAAAIAGLVAMAAAEPQDAAQYRAAADTLYQRLADAFDASHGVFESKSVYRADDVGWIIAALNSLVQQGNDATKPPAARMLLAFYESTMSLGGMQLSAPPGKNGAMAGEFEKDLPSVVYYHPADTPPPPIAGKLMVPAEEITWDGTVWQVTSDRFVPGSAMHLANELNWLGPHLGSLPFPLAASPSVSRPGEDDGVAETDITVVGKDILFDTDVLLVPAGEEVTITFENLDDNVPHNFHVQAGAEGDFRTEIENGPISQTLTFTIDSPGTYTYVCDVHPATMLGTITVE
ncbi:MAG: cupredoxin domain-containing protein [Chloroflexi bacterium]|nr:cupredoxin domain-containing protein [Chloroflexota bacterium]